jgi:predicted nucleotidyltransferase
METTKNKLTPQEKKFLDGLSEYLDTKLIYYGSIQRHDYAPGKSDIDIDIFTDNEESIMTKIQHYLKVSRKEFKKIVWHMNRPKKIVNGYKIKYTNSFIKIELSIYNNIYKQYVLKEHQFKITLPTYAYGILYILKLLYYYSHIISKSSYIYLKNKVLTLSLGIKEDEFIIL